MHYFHCLNERKRWKHMEIGKYLEEGIYEVICPGRSFLVKEGTPIAFIQMISKRTEAPLVKNIKVYNIYGNGATFRGQIAMSTDSGYRYFDYKRGESCKVFNNLEEAAQTNNAFLTFRSFFKTTILSINNDYCIEKIINNKPRNEWNEAEVLFSYKHIIENYISYIKFVGDKKQFVIRPVGYGISLPNSINAACKSLYLDIVANISSLNEVCYMFCHRDLHFGNTLMEGDKLYLIDYDFSKEEVFFYDLFNVMYVEFSDWHNTNLLDMYLREDNEISSLFRGAFSAIGTQFESSKKVEYIYVFLLSRFACFILDPYRQALKKNSEKQVISICSKINNFMIYIKEKNYELQIH